MKLNDRRLDHLSTGLSPRERAVMRLRAFKDDAPEPSGVYRSTPDAQIPEINRLLAVANATHREITRYAVWLQSRADAISLRSSLAFAFALMGSPRSALDYPRRQSAAAVAGGGRTKGISPGVNHPRDARGYVSGCEYYVSNFHN